MRLGTARGCGLLCVRCSLPPETSSASLSPILSGCALSEKEDFDGRSTVKGQIRDPLAWVADCEAQLGFDIEPEAKAASRQLAAEFQAAALELRGLVSAFQEAG